MALFGGNEMNETLFFVVTTVIGFFEVFILRFLHYKTPTEGRGCGVCVWTEQRRPAGPGVQAVALTLPQRYNSLLHFFPRSFLLFIFLLHFARFPTVDFPPANPIYLNNFFVAAQILTPKQIDNPALDSSHL